jgi:hypothetical protein
MKEAPVVRTLVPMLHARAPVADVLPIDIVEILREGSPTFSAIFLVPVRLQTHRFMKKISREDDSQTGRMPGLRGLSSILKLA